MERKGLIITSLTVSIIAILLLVMPHVVQSLSFLAKLSWYNGLLVIIFIFSAVITLVSYQHSVSSNN